MNNESNFNKITKVSDNIYKKITVKKIQYNEYLSDQGLFSKLPKNFHYSYIYTLFS